MAIDAYLKIPNVTGEVTNPNFKDQIALSSFSWGGEQASSMGTASGGSGAGKVTMHRVDHQAGRQSNRDPTSSDVYRGAL